MASNTTMLSTLPSELLSEVFSYLPLRDLLTLRTVSTRFNSAASWLVSSRFRHAEALDGHTLVFDCVAPSNRSSAPSIHCLHKGSSPLSPTPSNSPAHIYSHFVPISSSKCPVTTIITLDASVLFTQLSISCLLAKPLPSHRGLYSSILELLPNRYFRLRRSWLLAAARATSQNRSSLLWVDDLQNFGLRVKVSRAETGATEESEDEDIIFEVEFEEVLVRTGVVVDVLEKRKGTAENGAFVENLMPGRGKGGSVFVSMPWYYSYPWLGVTAQQQWA